MVLREAKVQAAGKKTGKKFLKIVEKEALSLKETRNSGKFLAMFYLCLKLQNY